MGSLEAHQLHFKRYHRVTVGSYISSSAFKYTILIPIIEINSLQLRVEIIRKIV